MKAFFCGLVIGLIGGIFALQNHVVRTGDGVVVVARTTRPPLRSTYVDVRDWSAAMWTQYPEVAAAVVQAGRSDLITENALGNFLNGGDSPGKGTPATSTSSVFDVPIRLLQQNTSDAPQTNVPVPPADHYSPAPVANPGSLPVFAPHSSAEVVPLLGESAPFPPQYQHPGQMEMVLPSGTTPLPAQGGSITVAAPATETTPRAAAPSSPPVIQDRAAGADPEWVRGLLKSLIPESAPPTTPTQNTSTEVSAPIPGANTQPATAGEFWKPASYQKLLEPIAPLQAVRPF